LQTLAEIERRVSELAAQIDAAGCVLPTFGCSEDGARPHIEVNAHGMHYVIVERGQELKRVTSFDFDEILWHVFEAVTFSLAVDYELARRQAGKDCRRLIFARQVELLSALSAEWAQREAAAHHAILTLHPFDDGAH
jgi:hypothetical protein